ncbi:hypothetical protein OAA60_01925 [Porticoccaceae bacterium]|jgi:hypothetical protein|nr:hypothetical protein [Porticoccaceae bacterium]
MPRSKNQQTRKRRNQYSFKKMKKKRSNRSRSIKSKTKRTRKMQKGHGNRKNIGGTRSAREDRLYCNTLRNSFRQSDNESTLNGKFNTLFHSAAVYHKIIRQSLELEGKYNLYYISYVIKSTSSNGTIQLQDESKLTTNIDLSDPSSPDGKYLIRLLPLDSPTAKDGHAICVIKNGNSCVVYDSNDSIDGQYGYWGTGLFVSKILENYDKVISGYGQRKNKSMVYDICTLFALYVWLIGEVPENESKNKKQQHAYTMRILNGLMNKLEELQLPELNNYINGILKLTTTLV